jgi:pimeloyl-ACP methyl ester carboxylesterase
MSQGIAEVNNINIWWEDFGDPSNPSVLLIMGANANALLWREDFINPIVESGFHVVRFDNRDVGKSTWVTTEPTFNIDAGSVVASEVSYTLEDMASDAVALMDHLNIQKAHIIGASMGGMITQVIGLDYPERVSSLTPIMSSPGIGLEDSNLQGPTQEMMEAIIESMKLNMEGEYEDALVVNYKVLSGSRFPFNEEKFREKAKEVIAHGHNPFPGHGAAVGQSPHRGVRLPEIDIPTLVIHGTEDAILPYDHGQALAEGIKNAEFMTLEGVGHEIPEELTEEITQKIISHIRGS